MILAIATFAGVARDKFHYVPGEYDTKVHASSVNHNRVFCAECGSNILADLAEEPDSPCLSMSAIDGDPPRPPGYHLYVGSKAVRHEITDDLEQYDAEPPE
jgi:hypothetical protein